MRGRSRGSLALLFNPFGDSAVDLLPGSSEPHSGRQTSSSADERHVWTVTDREKKKPPQASETLCSRIKDFVD